MYQPEPHPDTLRDWQDFKAIKRGGKQSADTAAMEAMFDAITAGKSREEAERIFSQTYQNTLHGNRRENQKAHA